MTETEQEKPRKGPQRDVATIADLVSALRPQTGDDASDADDDDDTGGTHATAGGSGTASPPGGPKTNDDPTRTEGRTDGVELSHSLPMAPEDDLSKVRGKASARLVSIVESLVFAAERPLGVRDLRRILKEPTVRQIQLALKALRAQTEGRGVVLGQVAGGFRLRTNPDNARYVQRMLAGRPARLSRMQLETLAIVAYRQPITKAEVDHVRGVDCGAVLKLLLERELLRIVGRKEEAGRPNLYGTTVEFLEFFNLMSLRDMPDLHEFRELSDDSRAHLREQYGEGTAEVEAEALGGQARLFDEDATEEQAMPEGARGADTPTVSSEDAASEDAASEDAASEDAASEDAASEDAASEDAASEDAASEDAQEAEGRSSE